MSGEELKERVAAVGAKLLARDPEALAECERVSAVVRAAIAPVLEAVSASERINRDDLSIVINARG